MATRAITRAQRCPGRCGFDVAEGPRGQQARRTPSKGSGSAEKTSLTSSPYNGAWMAPPAASRSS